MNFNEFCNEVKNRLDERLANKKVSTDIEKFNAVNKNYTGLRITYIDSKLSPVFNISGVKDLDLEDYITTISQNTRFSIYQNSKIDDSLNIGTR